MAPSKQTSKSMLLSNLIPGAELFKGLSNGLVENLSDFVEKGVEAYRGQLASSGGIGTLGRIGGLIGGASLDSLKDASRNSSEIIKSRGFKAEEYDVVTDDGYILTIQRIINPLVDADKRAHLKPILLQHGLITSSADWIVTSSDVRPRRWPTDELDNEISDNKQFEEQVNEKLQSNRITSSSSDSLHPKGLGFYLANEGYDVFLGNSRGNFYGQRHTKISSWNLKFWNFSFDEQIKFDLPAIIGFIRKLTDQPKLAYVGHSQGSAMIFGLLADRPEYADIIEPVVALAPVAHVGQCLSPVRHVANYAPLKLLQNLNLWFIGSNPLTRYLSPKACKTELIRRDILVKVVSLLCGHDEDELDDQRLATYIPQMASGTSVKNVIHWAQLVNSGKFAHYDHGLLANQLIYNQSEPPIYDLSRIRSHSIILFTADNDWLASPADIALLKSELKVPIFKVINVTLDKPKWNHIDFVYGMDAGKLVNARIVELLAQFR